MEAAALVIAVEAASALVLRAAAGAQFSNGIESAASLPSDVILVTAHPDDEAMFFAPTMRYYASHPTVRAHILCLSTGDADGKGKEREKELRACCVDVLGMSRERVHVVNDPLLLDGFAQSWSPEAIRVHLDRAVKRVRALEGASKVRLITFDAQGVSGHPNHIDMFRGVVAFARADIAKMNQTKDKATARLLVHVLRSPGKMTKYLGTAGAAARYFLPTPSLKIAAPQLDVCASCMAAHASQIHGIAAHLPSASCAYLNELIRLRVGVCIHSSTT